MPAARWWRARRHRRSSRNSGRSPARSGRIRGDCRPSRARNRRSFVRRPVKWLVGVVAALLVLVVAALILVPFLVDTPRVQALIASNASQALGRPVKFRSMSISVLPLPAVALHGLEIADDPQFGTEPFLKLETGKVRLKLLPLLTGRVELGDVKLTKPVITVIQTADGRMNISTLGTGAGTKEPKASERAPRGGGGTGGGGAALPAAISIEHGLVAYVARGKGGVTSQYRVEDLNLTLTGGAPQLAFKGDLKVKPGDLVVKIADGQVALDGGKPLTEAPLRGAVTLDAKDIGDLAKNALGPTPAFGGALKGKLALSGTLGAPDVSHTLSGPGALKIGRGKVVGPRALALLGGIVRVGGAVSSLLSSDLPNLGDSPLEFDSITGTYQIVNGVLNTKDLLYTSRAMKILIAGSYGFATERMDLDMTITHGRGELKAKVTGPASSPSIRVNPATILREVDKGKIDKGLGDLLKRIR